MPESTIERSNAVGHFKIEVSGIEMGTFTEVSGLAAEIKIEEITEGGRAGFVHKIPSQVSWPNLVLKRGVVSGDDLFEWFNDVALAVASGQGFVRQTASVSAVDPKTHDALRTWDFEGVIPVKWTGPNFQAGGSQIQIEELELAHHGFRRA